MFKSTKPLPVIWGLVVPIIAIAFGVWAVLDFPDQLGGSDRGMAVFVTFLLGPLIFGVVFVLVGLVLGAAMILFESNTLRSVLALIAFGILAEHFYFVPAEEAKRRETEQRTLDRAMATEQLLAEQVRKQRQAESAIKPQPNERHAYPAGYERLKSEMLQERENVPHLPADKIPEQLQVDDLSGKRTHYKITNISTKVLDIQMNTIHTGTDSLDVIARHAYLPVESGSTQQTSFRLKPSESIEVTLPEPIRPGFLEFELWDQKAGQYGKYIFKTETAFVPLPPGR